MFTQTPGVRVALALGAAGVVLGLAGCAPKVKRDDFNNEVARLREEMQAGDRQVAGQIGGRIDSTNQAVADHARRLDALDQELQAFRSEYNVSMEKVKGMLKFNVPVHFEFASSELRETDRPVLDRFASVVKEYYPGAIVTVEGFTDPSGTAAYNQRLGQRRADAVKEYLATAGGFTSESVKAVSYGEARKRQVVPGARGPGDAGIENRRVALVIDHAAVASDQVAFQ
ncbi:MAG TPA: OmpA family protein [Gemmatimonadales bacterium]|nr:OmpA family protein [Gemmatimonadales bacterium]